MAVNKSIIRLKGSVGGMTFYELDGVNLVREQSGPDKAKIMTDPAFKRTRENMSEFGGAARAGKGFRRSFSDVVRTMRDRDLNTRMVRLMKRLMNLSPGARGKRAVDVALNKLWFKGFEFNDEKTLGSVFFAHYDEPSFSANRDVITLSIPEFDSDACINPPAGCTHFKLVMACGVLSNYSYDDVVKEYIPVESEYNGIRGLDISDPVAYGGMTGSPIDLNVDLGVGTALPAGVTVMAAVGIVFYQQINTQFYELASDNAMRIDAVS